MGAKPTPLDSKTQEALSETITKLAEAGRPIVFIGEKADQHRADSVVKGLKKIKRNLVSITEEELLKLSEEEYQNLVQEHDFLITIDVSWDKEITSYFPFDLRQNGAYVLSSSVLPNKRLEDVDVYMIMELPGLFAHIIRGLLMKERG